MKTLTSQFAFAFALIVTLGLHQFAVMADDKDDNGTATDSTTIDMSEISTLTWSSDYGASVSASQDNERMLFVCFDRPDSLDISTSIDRMVADDPDLAELFSKYEIVRVTTDAEFKTKNQSKRLLDYSAFREMLNRPGIAIIDYENADSEYYGRVVSVYPVTGTRQLNRIALSTILSLPPGSLTQRTLVTAVSLHQERPKSIEADWDPTLAHAVEDHSHHQARINRQGHHNWESRFHRLNALLGNGERTQEVCAESWPGQTLVEAAEECVHSWRQSSGHWSAVSARQRRFAYDMKRGSNGIWYATGIFSR